MSSPLIRTAYDGATFTAITSANQNAVQRVGYIGSKRYLRGVLTSTGATVGANIGILILLGEGSGRVVT